MRCLLCPSKIGRDAPRVHDLAVLVVGKADRTVVRPIPCTVGANRFPCAVRILDFKLQKKLRFRTVLIGAAPRAARAAVPAVGQLHRQLVPACFQHGGHVIGLVLNALFVVRQTRRKHKIADFHAVELRFIQPAGGDVQPRPMRIFLDRKGFAEAVHGIALFFVDHIIAGDPFCSPIGLIQKPCLKECFRPFARLIVFIPEANTPVDALPAVEWKRVNGVHGSAFHLAAVPVLRDNPIGRLLRASLAVPHQAGMC